MDSEKLTTEQARRMHKSLFRLANYLCRVVKRMERTRFPPGGSNRRGALMAPFAAFPWTSITSPAKAEWEGSPKRRTKSEFTDESHATHEPSPRRSLSVDC